MRWPVRIVRASFWTFAIVTITSLAPSAGLITLTVPDEPYNSATTLPDTLHLNKRFADAQQFSFDAHAVSYALHPRLQIFGTIIPSLDRTQPVISALPSHIRAPPMS